MSVNFTYTLLMKMSTAFKLQVLITKHRIWTACVSDICIFMHTKKCTDSFDSWGHAMETKKTMPL